MNRRSLIRYTAGLASLVCLPAIAPVVTSGIRLEKWPWWYPAFFDKEERVWDRSGENRLPAKAMAHWVMDPTRFLDSWLLRKERYFVGSDGNVWARPMSEQDLDEFMDWWARRPRDEVRDYT